MQIQAEPFEDYSILHLHGEFDGFHGARVREQIDDLVETGVKYVALDLRKVRFINSTALGMLVQASKDLGQRGGRLVVTRPSPFCRDIMTKIRLQILIPICDSDVEARRALFEACEPLPSPQATEAPEILEDESALLFTPTEAGRVEAYIPEGRRLRDRNPVHRHRFGTYWWGVGRVTGLSEDGLRFEWSGGQARLTPFEMGQMLAVGTGLKVKFRLPLLRKGHCQATVTVREMEEHRDGVRLAASFEKIDPEERKAVRRYTRDLNYLRQELGPDGPMETPG